MYKPSWELGPEGVVRVDFALEQNQNLDPASAVSVTETNPTTSIANPEPRRISRTPIPS